ncbi:MAG: fimbria/pilus outer membrane usher protein, partial [Qipengyuania sp.]
VSGDVRFSHENDVGVGTLTSLTVESSGRIFSARGGAVLTSANYRDSASKLGDPPPPESFFAQFSFNFAENSRIQLSAARQQLRFDPRSPDAELRRDIADLSVRTRVFDRFDVFASAGYRGGRDKAVSGFLGVSMQFGGGKSAQLSANINRNRVSGAASYRKFDTEEGDLGYSIEANADPYFHRFAGGLSKQLAFARVEGQVEEVNGRIGARANARGSLLFAKGALFARKQTGGAYALVLTGDVDGVTVMRENREAGVTSRGGLLLIENVPEQVPISIDVDPDKLPYDALARSTYQRVVVPRRAVGLVELDVIRFSPRMFRLVSPEGEPIAAGARVTMNPSGETTLIGFGGLVEINAASDDGELLAQSGATQCKAQLIGIEERTEGSDIVCLPHLVAQEAANTGELAGARGGLAKVARRD